MLPRISKTARFNGYLSVFIADQIAVRIVIVGCDYVALCIYDGHIANSNVGVPVALVRGQIIGQTCHLRGDIAGSDVPIGVGLALYKSYGGCLRRLFYFCIGRRTC